LLRRSAMRVGGSNSVVESQPSKLLVAGSIPVSRSKTEESGFRNRESGLGKESALNPDT
jgi:hypothetical protein